MKHTLLALATLALCSASSFAGPLSGNTHLFVEPLGVVTSVQNLSITAGQTGGMLALTITAGNADDRRMAMFITKQKADAPTVKRVMAILAKELNALTVDSIDYEFFASRLGLTIDKVVLNQKAAPLDFVVRQ